MTERPALDRDDAAEGAAPLTRDSDARPAEAFEVEGEATLFGFEPTVARTAIAARSRGWRLGGSARIFAVFVVIAPFVAIFPPHAVWPIGALLTGAILARRRWVERFTLLEVDGTCPKCGTPYSIKRSRLRVPHPLPCETCHHQGSLRLPPGTLGTHARA